MTYVLGKASYIFNNDVYIVEWSLETAELCIKYKDAGVVGIDVAGNEAAYVGPNGKPPYNRHHRERCSNIEF